MAVRLGVGNALVQQPGVQLVEGFEPQPWREEALPDKPNLVLDLALLPARRWRAGDRVDEVMAAHLHEAAVGERNPSAEERLHPGVPVFLQAPYARSLEQSESAARGAET